MSTDNQPQQLRIVSQAQFGFFNNRLNYMSKHGLDTDPETGIDRQTIVQALQAVRYADLPPRAGRSAPKTWQPPAQPKALPSRVEAIKSGSKVACYLVTRPGPLFFISSPGVWDKLHTAMPEVKRAQCLTLKEARSFMELEGVKVKSLKEAAEWWASPAPAEPTLKPPPAADKPWVDAPDLFSDSEYEAEDDSDVFN